MSHKSRPAYPLICSKITNACLQRISVKYSIAAFFCLLFSFPQLVSAQPESDLSLDLVDQRIEQLNATGDNGELSDIYEEVRRLLNEKDAFDRESAEYTEAMTSAPQLEAAIQKRLDNITVEYDAEAEITGFAQEELNERLQLARAENDDLNRQLDALDRTLAARESITAQLRDRLQTIDEALELVDASVRVETTAEPSLAEASEWRELAKAKMLAAERRARQAELTSQPLRFSAMVAQRAELMFETDQLAKLIAELSARVTESPLEVTRAEDIGISISDPAAPVATALLEQDLELARERKDLQITLTRLQTQQDQLAQLTRALEERYTNARRIADYAGDSEDLGRALFIYWREIDELELEEAADLALPHAGTIVISRVEHEELLASLASASGYVNERLHDAGLEPETVSPGTRARLFDLVRNYRERLKDVVSLESQYLTALSDLQSSRNTLETEIEQYRAFLRRLVLWFPNHPPLWLITPEVLSTELQTIADKTKDIQIKPGIPTALFFILALLLWTIRQRLLAVQAAMNLRISRPRSDGIQYTLIALFVAAVRALPGPLLLLGVAAAFEAAPGYPDFGALLVPPAGLLFIFELMRVLSEPDGIGQLHFGWQTATTKRVREEFTLLIRWWLPLAVLAGFANLLTPGLGDEAIGRLTTMIAIGIVAIYFGRYVIRELRAEGTVWFSVLLNKLRLLLMAIFIILLFTVLSGRMFTVLVLFESLIASIFVGTALLLLHAVLQRWLLVVRRKLRFNELLAQNSQTAVEAVATDEGGGVDESTPDLGELSHDTQQLLKLFTVVAGLVAALAIWEPLLPALDTMGSIQLWSTSSEVDGEVITNQITLATVVVVLALAAVTLIAASRLPALVEMILRSRTSVSPGVRYTISTLLNYLIVGVGIVAALSALGLQWSQLQWLVAALGVGIGFGLQEIVANFISGLIILFERPIRVGDIVTVGDKDGTVTKIRIRATTIRDWDGKELLVPNKEFITGRLLNWSLSDSQTRLVIPVGIAYGSDVEKALSLLRDIILEHPNTLDEPEPRIVFEHFGDNALELSARCFIGSLEGRLQTMTELRTAINKAFTEADIVIAFPQRDIHLESSTPIRIQLDSSPDS